MYSHKRTLQGLFAHDENMIVFSGTAKRNEIKKDLLWAGGKLYRLIDDYHPILVKTRDHDDFPHICPFEKSSDLWGITIYKTANISYFTFEIA